MMLLIARASRRGHQILAVDTFVVVHSLIKASISNAVPAFRDNTRTISLLGRRQPSCSAFRGVDQIRTSSGAIALPRVVGIPRDVAGELNDEVVVSLVEQAFRHAHTISDFRATKPLSGSVPREP